MPVCHGIAFPSSIYVETVHADTTGSLTTVTVSGRKSLVSKKTCLTIIDMSMNKWGFEKVSFGLATAGIVGCKYCKTLVYHVIWKNEEMPESLSIHRSKCSPTE